MVSYSSWNGDKMHGNQYLITDVLKGELGFAGFVVSDWAAIDQLDGQTGFTAAEVADSINAGIDMVMVPNDYKTFLQLPDRRGAGRADPDDPDRRRRTGASSPRSSSWACSSSRSPTARTPPTVGSGRPPCAGPGGRRASPRCC